MHTLANMYMNTYAAVRFALEPLLLLTLRLYLAWTFFKSGLIKFHSWDTTLWFFSAESVQEAVGTGNYFVPLLSSKVAAVMGTGAELILPVLLALGILGNLTATVFFFFNVIAVISFPDLWYTELKPGFYIHVFWGVQFLTLIIYGSGKISLDALVCKIFFQDKKAS